MGAHDAAAFEPCKHCHELSYLFLPRHCEAKHLAGANHFVTRAVFSLDQVEFPWESRAHRKRVVTRERRRIGRYWCWKFRKISYWVALLFFVGSLCFCFSSVALYTKAEANNGLFKAYIGWPSFVGSVFFTIGSFLQLCEVMSAPAVPRELKNHPGAPHHRPKMLAFQFHRLDFIIALVQQIGALVFNINTFTGSGAFEWGKRGLYLAVWMPDVIASTCFVAAGYLGLVEYCHAWWKWQPRDPIFWLNIFNWLGGIGFLLNAIFGIAWLEPSVPYNNGLTFFWLLFGSLCFQCGSYLGVWEQANDNEKEEEGNPAGEREKVLSAAGASPQYS